MERLANSNYYSAKAYYGYKLNRKSRQYKEPPLLIYQMGKVGSRTVHKSLRALKLDMPIYHVHHLTRDYIAQKEERTKKYFYIKNKPRHIERSDPWQLRFLRKQIDKGLNGHKWRIVTLVRDPIAVNISTFFHHFREIEVLDSVYRIKSAYFDFETTIKLGDIEILTELFLEKVDHDRPLKYFDRELKSVFGIDVFASKFPKSKGYNVYEEEPANVLLIRLENLNKCAGDAFKEFLNIEGLTLTNTNRGIKKDYNIIYQMFKDSVVLPNTYIDKMYRSKYMQHFYSEEEIKRFKTRWRTSRNCADANNDVKKV